jgi:hypothetical protein
MRRPCLVLALAASVTAVAANAADAQIGTSSPYLDIVARYARGEFTDAVVALAAFPDNDLHDRIFDHDLPRVIVRRITGDDDLRQADETERRRVAETWSTLVPAAALLHVETGALLMDAKEPARGIQHVRIATRLVDWEGWGFIETVLKSDDWRRRHERFRRDVYLAIAWALQLHRQAVALDEHLARAREAWPRDAEVLLASGSAEEMFADDSMVNALPRRPADMRPGPWKRLTLAGRLARAESYHRDAVRCDPTLAEAQLRLGRVLHLRKKFSEARRSLETARDLRPVSDIGYLSALFLAQLTQDEGDAEAALEQYAELVTRWPGCQSGHIGLSRAYEGRGDRQAARDALAPLWHLPDKRACAVDPWWVYPYGQVWRLKPLIEALRAQVRT